MWLPASDLRGSHILAAFTRSLVQPTLFQPLMEAAATYVTPHNVLATISGLELHRCKSRAESFSACGTVILREDMHTKHFPL